MTRSVGRGCPLMALAVMAGVLLPAACKSAAPPPPPPPAPPEVIEPARAPEPPRPPPPMLVRVTGSTVNIRGGASAQAAIVAKARKGEKLTLVEQQADWYRVRLPEGKEGWISARYARKEEPCLPDAAPQLLNAPPLSFDATGASRGRVVVQAHVDADGRIVSTKVVEDTTRDASLAAQAIAEVNGITFVAPVRNCRKVAFLYNYARTF